MLKRQSEKLNMYETVNLEISESSLIWAGYLPYVNANTAFTNFIALIFAAAQEQERIINGYAQEKQARRLKMATSALTISNKIQGYATDQEDEVLYGEMSFIEADFMQGKSNIAAVFAKAVFDKAEELDALILPYGVTDADRLQLDTDILNYKAYISKPRQAIVDVKTATDNLKQLFRDTDAVLKKKMDKLMKNFKISAPDFYSDYFNARKIVKTATNFTEIRALIKDKDNQNNLAGVEMIVSNAERTYTAASDITGVADAKQISPELYNIKFVLDGYKDVDVANVQVDRGELELLSVEMERE